MRDRMSHLLICASLLTGLSGCFANKASVSSERHLRTGMSSAEKAVILVAESRKDSVPGESESDDAFIVDCMAEAMRDKKPGLAVVPTTDFRRASFPGKRFRDTPRSAEALLAWLQDADSQGPVEKLGIRYLIVVSAETTTSNARTEVELAMDFPGWGIKQFWTRTSEFSAVVIDAKRRVKSGAILARSDGQAAVIYPMLLVLPLPPFPLFAPTESRACHGLGVAVIKFLEDGE